MFRTRGRPHGPGFLPCFGYLAHAPPARQGSKESGTVANYILNHASQSLINRKNVICIICHRPYVCYRCTGIIAKDEVEKTNYYNDRKNIGPTKNPDDAD
jgi:hypothetical protein